MINICIINRNFPPYRGATGYHANQLAQYLLSTGDFNVSVVTLGNLNYLSQPAAIHAIKPNYNGRNKILRLLGTVAEGYRLIKKAISLNADFYIVMTDPPLLNYWASKLLSDKNWSLWTMDLYPHGFIAGGLAQSQDLKTRHYLNVLKSNRPDFIISLGNQQREYISDIYPNTVKTVILPIGLRDDHHSVSAADTPSWSYTDKITLAYVGNLSEAHDRDLLPYIAANMDGRKMHLLISCYGAHAHNVIKQLEDLEHVTVLSNIPEADMSFIDVHFVSLAPEWTHICVPSKAISSLYHGAPVLFVGSTKSDTATIASSAGWTVSDRKQLKLWLDAIDIKTIKTKAQATEAIVGNLKTKLNEGWVQIANLISNSTVK